MVNRTNLTQQTDGQKKLTFLDLHFYSGSISRILALVDNWIKHDKHYYICVTSVHGLVESQLSPELKKIHNQSGLTVPDGMPLVWIGRKLGWRQTNRIYGPDLFLALCRRAAEREYRVYLYGTTAATLRKLKNRLWQKFPRLKLVGEYAPTFSDLAPFQEQETVKLINKAKPQLVFVGLSTPKQELWMARNISRLQANVLIGVGAAFDFVAGTKKQAPRWLQQLGLEWLFRLIHEPRRLWRRYLINNLLFLYWTAGFLGKRLFGLEKDR
ncbi:MAG: WecB/TagA/CpsF family glycosyltransferase [Patescibacteria group bacterium]